MAPHIYFAIRSRLALLCGFALLTATAEYQSAPVKAGIIDTFEAEQQVAQNPPPPQMEANAVSGPGIIGPGGSISGQRDLIITLEAGVGVGSQLARVNTSIVNPGALEYREDLGIHGRLELQWDGNGDVSVPNTLNHTGLRGGAASGVDLVSSGATGILLGRYFADAPVTLNLDVFTDETRSSSLVTEVDAMSNAFLFFPFNAFTQAAPGGPADFLDVGAIKMTVTSESSGLEMALSYIATTSAQITGAADFEEDGDVDGGDLSRWQLGFGAGAGSHVQGDADGDRDVDGGDFLTWQREITAPLASVAADAVPEPSNGRANSIECGVCAQT